MGCMKLCIYLLLIYCILFGICEGGRYGGGSRTTHSRPSTSYSRPSPSYSRPSPSYSHPSPSYSRPSTNIGWNTPASVSVPKSTVHQTNSAPRGPPSSRPIGWDVNKPSSPGTSFPQQPKVSVPQQNAAPHGPPSNSRPIGWDVNKPSSPGTSFPQQPKVSVPHQNNAAPHGPPSNSRPIGWDVNKPSTGHIPSTQTRYPGTNQKPVTTVHYPGSSTNVGGINRKPAHTTSYQPPPPPGPHGPPITGGSTNYYTGPKKVKIVNKYYSNHPGYYSLPQPNYHYPGYYYTPSSYHYSSSDVGSGTLGFFLGYSLAKLTTPTYSHYSFYDGYRPRYDHYTVIHYHHNKEQAPREPVLQPNSIVGCVGDTTTVCPGNTTSLCTTDGTLMCVVSATHTQPCTDNRQVNCVRSTVPCINSTIEGCKDTTTNSTVINIPCVTTAKVFGNITFVNNTIIVNGTTTNSTGSTTNSTNTTITTTTVVPIASTQYPITTTPEPPTTTPVRRRRRRDTISVAPQNFCVTVLALPAKKPDSEGEKLFKTTKSIISNFIVNAWGLRN